MFYITFHRKLLRQNSRRYLKLAFCNIIQLKSRHVSCKLTRSSLELTMCYIFLFSMKVFLLKTYCNLSYYLYPFTRLLALRRAKSTRCFDILKGLDSSELQIWRFIFQGSKLSATWLWKVQEISTREKAYRDACLKRNSFFSLIKMRLKTENWKDSMSEIW